MQKQETKPAAPADLREVAAVLTQRLEKELPVLRNMAGALDSRENHTFFRLAAVVHNLAVIDHAHIHLLLGDLCALYAEVMSGEAWCAFAPGETERNRLHECRALLQTLYDQEQEAQRREREQGNTDMECMQHVEYDLSCLFPPLMDLLSAGYTPNRRERNLMRRLTGTCSTLLRRCLQAKEQAYRTARQITDTERRG